MMSAYGEILDYVDKKRIMESMLDEHTKQFRGMSFETDYAECKSFYSYDRWIADYMKDTGILVIDLDWFDCSATTRCQFSKWLNTNGYVPYTTVKRVAKRVRRKLERKWLPIPTGEVFLDDVTGTKFMFLF